MFRVSSLELRSSIVDVNVIDQVMRLLAVVRICWRQGKPLGRFEPLVPSEVWSRRMHRGAPVARWLRTELAPLFENQVLGAEARAATVFDREALMALWSEHVQRERDGRFALWAALTFDGWLRRMPVRDQPRNPLTGTSSVGVRYP